jgi:mono/diheme cytochrome c family protein
MKPLTYMALGAALVLASLGAGALAVVEFGLFDTTAATPHGPIIGWAMHATMMNSTRFRARQIKAPEAFNPAEVRAGFALYDAHCALCHGGPGVPRATWVAGMTPTPPFLVDAAPDWTPAQLDLIVADGVKMTAMPGWRPVLSEGQIWDVVAFLKALPYLSEKDYAAMRLAAPGPVSPPPARLSPPPAAP